MGVPYVTYDEDADALYVGLADEDVARTQNLGDLRMVDLASDGTVLGIEFIDVSAGVDLDGVPFGPTVAAAIGDSGLPIKVFA
ncbi:MAG TPA: DUF2283 domain-containing protein [Tepidiformaceae bacterium]|nr:DUF2283 domain-containing protein [Tepidiformaceae bacterium]HNO64905.1 DUF2283 domain-containing protein [Tepidiformaceae bacterium]